MEKERHKPKTLLIYPSLTGHEVAQIDLVTEPLGLAYIAAVLEENGYEVNILDALGLGNEQRENLPDGRIRIGLTENQIADYVRNYAPDIIGISCGFSVYASDSHRVARCVRQVCPKALIVFGGVHTTVAPDSVLKDNNVDVAVRGEGEMTFLEVVRCIHEGKEHFSIKGTVVRREDGSLIYNDPRELIKDLDQLPFPARHLLPMEKYFEFQRRGKALYRYYMRKPIANIVTSRGCPYNCIFCGVGTIWGRTWRYRSAESVVKEIKLLVDRYGVREFTPWDDNISVDKKRLVQICQGLIDNGLGLRWATPNGIYLPSLDWELLGWMVRSGYYRTTFGIESGSPETLRFVRKRIDFDQVRKVVDMCDKLGIWTNATFIIGFPEENIDSIKATIRAPIDLGFDFSNFFIAQPFLGTDLYNIFDKSGLLKNGIQEGSSTIYSKYDTKYFTHEELMKFRDQAYRKLYIHRILSFLKPSYYRRLYRKINSVEKFAYFLRLVTSALLGFRIGRLPVSHRFRKYVRRLRQI